MSETQGGEEQGRLEHALGQIREQAGELTESPFVTLTTIAALIDVAISHGAGIFNDGDVAGCYRLYAATAREIEREAEKHELTSPTGRIVEGLLGALERAEQADDPGDAAWMMRHAFDRSVIEHQLAMERIQWMMRLGEAAFARGDYGGSGDVLAQAAELAPAIWGPPSEEVGVQIGHLAMLYYGNVLLIQRHYQEAYEALTAGIGQAPALGQISFDLTDLGPHWDVFQERLDELEDLEEGDAAYPVALFLRAYLRMFSGGQRRAQELLSMHLSSHPEDEAAHYLLALGTSGAMA